MQSNPSSSTLDGNGGVYRPRSYDNLQNGKSQQQHQKCSLQTLLPTTTITTAQQQQYKTKHKHKQKQKQKQKQKPELQIHHETLGTPHITRSPATSSYRLNLRRSLHLPLSPSFDVHNSPLPLLHHHQHHQQQQHQQQQHFIQTQQQQQQQQHLMLSATAASTTCSSTTLTATTSTHHQIHQQTMTSTTSATSSIAHLPPPPPMTQTTTQKRPSTLQLQLSVAPATSTTTLTTIHTTAPQPPGPTDFKYYSPQRHTDANLMRNLPFGKNARAMRRQSTQSVDSQKVNIAGYQPLPMRQRYKHHDVLFELKSPTNRLTIRECDFGGGGEPCDDDQSIKDSQIFRVSKRNLYMNHRSPWKERDRYSNLYEYSLNIDLNSIIEDAAGSDSS